MKGPIAVVVLDLAMVFVWGFGIGSILSERHFREQIKRIEAGDPELKRADSELKKSAAGLSAADDDLRKTFNMLMDSSNKLMRANADLRAACFGTGHVITTWSGNAH